MSALRKTCSSCNAFSPNPQANPKSGQPRQGWCRAAPPMFLPAAGQDALGRPAVIHQGVWPPTNDDQWCRAWEPIDEIEAEYSHLPRKFLTSLP